MFTKDLICCAWEWAKAVALIFPNLTELLSTELRVNLLLVLPLDFERDFDDLVAYIYRVKGDVAITVMLYTADPSLIVESEL